MSTLRIVFVFHLVYGLTRPISADTRSEAHRNNEIINELQRSIKELERRLSSVEQPIWPIRRGDESTWAECGQGQVCRCMIGTKSLNCWNHRMQTVSADQVIPVDIVNM